MDSVFGAKNFRNEIVWKRINFHNNAHRFGHISDRIFFYSKSDKFIFNKIKVPYSEEQINRLFYRTDENGRKFQLQDLTASNGKSYEFCGVVRPWRFNKERMLELDRQGHIWKRSKVPRYLQYLEDPELGVDWILEAQTINDLWTDIPSINFAAKERLGYATQKPEAMLERIIKASSNEDDIVLDPFSGTGTTIAVAQRLKRQWIGMDVSLIAIDVIVKRLAEREEVGLEDFNLECFPFDDHQVERLKRDNPEAYETYCKVMTAKSKQTDLGLLPKFDRNELLKKLGVKIKD